jgi:MASE9 protein
MPSLAKAYIALVIAAGTLLLLLAAGSWSSGNLRQFAIYLGLAALASALKVRIPGMESTMSPNFIFLLMGMVALPFSQVAVISLAAALVQSLWASAKRPRLVQVAFSAAALVLSSSLAYKFAHFVLVGSATESAVVCVILAGSIYFPVNSGLVSMVIGFVEGQPFKKVCLRCYQWAFPYFMGGIAFAGLVSGAYAPSMLWKGALVLLPAAVLAYLYFASLTARVASAAMPVSASEEEEYAEIHS